jgi:hypothetical protein
MIVEPSGTTMQAVADIFRELNPSIVCEMSGVSAAIEQSRTPLSVAAIPTDSGAQKEVNERKSADFRTLFDELRPVNVSLPMLRKEWRLTRREEDLVKHLLPKLVKEGTLAVSGKKGISTAYSYTRDLCTTRDVTKLSDDLTEFPVALPLGIQRVGYIDNHSLILVHAPTGNGKSLFCHNILHMNMRQFGKERMRYFECEMGDSAITRKLRAMGITKELEAEYIDIKNNWQWENLPLLLLPDGLNIIDYLTLNSDKLHGAGEEMRKIKNALRSGIAIICMQTNPKTGDAYGGDFAKFEPAMVVAKQWDILKVTKIRESKMEETSPLGWQRSYTVKNGLMVPTGHSWEKIIKKGGGA